jgi:hypothetical protein
MCACFTRTRNLGPENEESLVVFELPVAELFFIGNSSDITFQELKFDARIRKSDKFSERSNNGRNFLLIRK